MTNMCCRFDVLCLNFFPIMTIGGTVEIRDCKLKL